MQQKLWRHALQLRAADTIRGATACVEDMWVSNMHHRFPRGGTHRKAGGLSFQGFSIRGQGGGGGLGGQLLCQGLLQPALSSLIEERGPAQHSSRIMYM